MKPEKIIDRLFVRITLLLGVLILFSYAPCFAQSTTSREKLQKTKRQLEEEIRYTNELLETAQKNKQTSLNKLQILAKKIRSREALINTINAELGEVQMKISVENVQIDRMSRQLQAMKLEYARMIYQAYHIMNGRNKLMFLFSAKDFNQAYQRLKYYQQYASWRRRQAERILSTQYAINSQRRELENVKNQKLTLIQEQQLEKQKLDREKTDKAKAVKEFTSREKQLANTLKTKQQAAQRLEYEIEKLIADEIKASEGRSKKRDAKDARTTSTGKTGNRSALEMTPRELELSTSFGNNRGRLPWPCERGIITSSFGEHPHPVLEYVKVKNNGIDIMTERGALVKAVFGGKVSWVKSFPNLNKVVIIRHGEYLTVYSNLDDVSVRDGQEITAKQTIGRVHVNPEDQKSELHFEIWRGKSIQDPEDWLARKY
ncbi:MAG: peptidoglycan DD-metalloendopeptidase family protein [Bacteroidales bacterium]|nr:peptidoglycan DD-metalloendopeptidase family protein [Bacteroidales bacterium]